MSRDPLKLRAFSLADTLVLDIYRATRDFPSDERFGLQAQIRRAAVSVAANIVEGSARRSTKEYLHFVNMAAGSAFETRYLVELAGRLNIMPTANADHLSAQYTILAKSLVSLLRALEDRP
jgi:four helix bundle protein